MNGRTLLRELRRMTGIRYNIQSSANDKGWTALLEIITRNKASYTYSTGDRRFIKKTGAEYYVAKNAALDLSRMYTLRGILPDDTAASKMEDYRIDFTAPVNIPNIVPTQTPSWYMNNMLQSPNVGSIPTVQTSTVSQNHTVQSTNTTISQNIDPTEYTTVVLVDLENIPLLNHKKYSTDTLYIGFLTVQHNSAYKYKDWDAYHKYDFELPSTNNKCIYYTDGVYREMVDHFMTFVSRSIIDYIIAEMPNCTAIYILSNDKSALCTKKCIKSMTKMKNGTNIKVKLINTLHHINEIPI